MLYPASSPRTLAETRKKALLTIAVAGMPVIQIAVTFSASRPASTATAPLTKRMRKITQAQGAHSSRPDVYGWVPAGRITKWTIEVSASEQIRNAAAAAGCE